VGIINVSKITTVINVTNDCGLEERPGEHKLKGARKRTEVLRAKKVSIRYSI
jgi:hypothetical protein